MIISNVDRDREWEFRLQPLAVNDILTSVFCILWFARYLALEGARVSD